MDAKIDRQRRHVFSPGLALVDDGHGLAVTDRALHEPEARENGRGPAHHQEPVGALEHGPRGLNPRPGHVFSEEHDAGLHDPAADGAGGTTSSASCAPPSSASPSVAASDASAGRYWSSSRSDTLSSVMSPVQCPRRKMMPAWALSALTVRSCWYCAMLPVSVNWPTA